MQKVTTTAELDSVIEDVMAPWVRRAAEYGAGYDRLWRELKRTVAGGRHFRGRLVSEIYGALGGKRHAVATRLGAAVEFLHAAFLVHDDLIDHDTVRRGEPNLASGMGAAAADGGASLAAVRHVSDASAVLAGDLALAFAHRLFGDADGSLRTREELADLLWEAVFVSVAGELDDVATAHGLWGVSLQKALAIATAKTAFYSFQLPLRAGAVLADASTGTRGSLDDAGRALGQAYQLADDLLGAFAPASVTGKDALSDVREGKATALMLCARTLPVWDQIRGEFGRSDLDDATGGWVRRALAASEAPQQVDGRARRHLEEVEQVMIGSTVSDPVAGVVMRVRAMVEGRLDEAAAYVAAAGQ